jgi:hypothetical protein
MLHPCWVPKHLKNSTLKNLALVFRNAKARPSRYLTFAFAVASRASRSGFRRLENVEDAELDFIVMLARVECIVG